MPALQPRDFWRACIDALVNVQIEKRNYGDIIIAMICVILFLCNSLFYKYEKKRYDHGMHVQDLCLSVL